MIGQRSMVLSAKVFSMEGKTSVSNFIKTKKRVSAGEERVFNKLKGKPGIENPYAFKNWMKKKRPGAYRKMARKKR